MTEKQFIQELEQALTRLPEEERTDILQDIQEYFSNGREDGKSEQDIAAELGSPSEIAGELIGSFDFSQAEFPAKSVNLTKNELDHDGFDHVDIQLDNGSLEIGPSSDGEVHVDIENKSYNQLFLTEVIDRKLVITLKDEVKKWGIFSFTISTKSPVVTVQLPSKMYESIKILSDNGKIEAEQLNSTVFDAKSDNGSIKLENITASTLTVKSDNGSVKLREIQADALSAKSDNGKIALKGADAKTMKLKSDNGSIVMENAAGNIEAESDNGKIHLQTPDLERNIDLKSDNGSITLETLKDPVNVSIRAHKNHGKASLFGSKSNKAVFGDGLHSVVLQSDNGSLTVKRL